VSRVRVLLAFFKVQFFIYISLRSVSSRVSTRGWRSAEITGAKTGFVRRSTCDCKSRRQPFVHLVRVSLSLEYFCIAIVFPRAHQSIWLILRDRDHATCRTREWRVNSYPKAGAGSRSVQSKCNLARDVRDRFDRAALREMLRRVISSRQLAQIGDSILRDVTKFRKSRSRRMNRPEKFFLSIVLQITT